MNVYCDSCAELIADPEVNFEDGQEAVCRECGQIGKVWFDMESDESGTHGTVDFVVVSGKGLSHVGFGTLVDGYEISQKKLNEALDEIVKLHERYQKLQGAGKAIMARNTMLEHAAECFERSLQAANDEADALKKLLKRVFNLHKELGPILGPTLLEQIEEAVR